MFKNLFNGVIENEKNIKNNTKQIGIFFYISDLFATIKNIINNKNKKTTNLIDYKTNANNFEFNKRLFYIKEDFYEKFDKFNTLFKFEWFYLYLYKNTINTQLIFFQNQTYTASNNFYVRSKQIKNNILINKNNMYWGFLSVWKALKIWVFSLSIFSVSFYILLIKRVGVLPQTLFFWVGLSMLLYWLISGFVFFVKKYQFSRYTSVVQRFWRRSYIIFWLIESGLLLVFFYLMINSTQESFYMFDQGYFLKTHLFSWKLFLLKCILVVSLITYSYLLLLNLKWSTFNKNILNLSVLTVLLLYLVWAEFYQIYWVSNFYANFSWLYDVDDSVWSLEFDGRRTRILNHYIMVLFLLKFWHIVFIFACWIFFLLRSNELEVITYPLYTFNFQNFIILFLMMWLFMYPWLKQSFHWIMELPYFWFYVDTHISFVKIVIFDIYNFYYYALSNFVFDNGNYLFNHTDFINWCLVDSATDFNVFIKSTIKEEVLKNLI